jgi:hypothetical protein
MPSGGRFGNFFALRRGLEGFLLFGCFCEQPEFAGKRTPFLPAFSPAQTLCGIPALVQTAFYLLRSVWAFLSVVVENKIDHRFLKDWGPLFIAPDGLLLGKILVFDWSSSAVWLAECP